MHRTLRRYAAVVGNDGASGSDRLRAVVDTQAARAARDRAARQSWAPVFAIVWTLAVIGFLAVAVLLNALAGWREGPSWGFAALCTGVPVVLLHVVHALVVRSGRERNRQAWDEVADRLDEQVERAGMPAPDRGAVLRMLRASDAGPVQPGGPAPDGPSYRWTFPVADDAARRLVVDRQDGPRGEVVVVTADVEGRADVAGAAVVGADVAEADVAEADVVGADVASAVLGAYRSHIPAPITASRLGGRPAAPPGFSWPRCAEHGAPMCFTAQLEHRGALVLLFFCQADPGGCASWDPDAGANAAVVVGGRDLELAAPPADATAALLDGDPWLLGVRAPGTAPCPTVGDAGQWGGVPEWIQGDEQPADTEFVAMLEEPPGTGVFGGGAAYVFVGPDGSATTLWQR